MMNVIFDILQIVLADLVLSGDNALVIGMAAAGLAPQERQKAIFYGMALAAGLRILFAILATHLLAIPGILLIGGGLLTWVCWRFYNDLKEFNAESIADAEAKIKAAESKGEKKNFKRAFVTILMADVSMSIDNIIAVAAIARENTTLLVFGLVLAILMMALFAQAIMQIMLRFRWLSYLGLMLLIFLAAHMFYDGLISLNLIRPLF